MMVAVVVPVCYGLSLVVTMFIYSVMCDLWFNIGSFEKEIRHTDESSDYDSDDSDMMLRA